MTTSPSPQNQNFPSSACDTFELRLNEVLDQRLDPQADVLLAEHVAACENCRHRLHISRRLLESFRSQPGNDAAAALSRQWARRIADQHAQELNAGGLQVQPAAATSKGQKNRRRLRPSAWFILLSTSAAAVAMAVTLQITLNRRGESASGIAKSATNRTKASGSMSGSTLALGHAGPPSWAEYEKTLKAWETALDPEGTHRESLESSVESSVEPIADSFRPVGHSFSTVLGGLRKTFPTSRIRRPKADDGALFFWERWAVA